MLLSQIELVFDVSFDLTFINIKFSSAFPSKILSFLSPQIFVFLIFTFVNICLKAINEIGGNIPGGNFLGGNFPGGNFSEGIFLEPNFSCET